MTKTEAIEVIEKIKELAINLDYKVKETGYKDDYSGYVIGLNIYENDDYIFFSVWVKTINDNADISFSSVTGIELLYDYDATFVTTTASMISWNDIKEVDYDFIQDSIHRYFKHTKAAKIIDAQYQAKVKEIDEKFMNAIKKYNNS